MSPLDRRSLLKYGVLGGALAFARPALPLAATTGEGDGEGAAGRVADFELSEATVADLGKRMESGELSSQRIVQLYLGRIQQLDQGEGGVHSVIELNPDAEEIAAALDRERRDKGARGPLHGIPIIIKDNLDTGDKMMTTAGSLALAGKPAPRDSTVAAKLRAAGMVILGKANLSEWANFRSTHSTSGWSGRGRQTHNPYALDRNPCGSSSGSGAAASANFCTLAI
ncbi:MAG TPA: amidase family protein, partial [Thermoanaerobaculia bacterium]|nr:amidase family protein [Thermoanaerobaculia bacterium]